MADLRQSTSTVVRFGPMLDSTDGITPETGLTITQADMQLSKGGASFAQKNASGNAVHDVDGFYFTTFNTTDLDTTKILKFQVIVTGALPFFETFSVVTQTYYDAKYTGTFNNLGGTEQTGDSFARIGSSGSGLTAIDLPNQTMNIIGNISGSITSVTNSVTVGAITNDAITSAAIQAGALDGKGDWNIGKTGYEIAGVLNRLDDLNDITTTQVNTEVLDVLTVDTFAETSYPGTTASILDKINYTYSITSNKYTQTATTQNLRNAADSGNLGTTTVSDDGTTYIRDKHS